MWKLLFQSVPGSSHERSGTPCQDSCRVRLRPTCDGPVLLLACADGAGSARLAEVGARLACRTITRLALEELWSGSVVADLQRETVVRWHHRLRAELEVEADRRKAGLHDLACTLLVAAVGETATAFAQIGDGAIIVGQNEGYETVFWPQNGEYANSTNFVTDPAFADSLEFTQRRGPVDELALMTDGLQMLALNFAGRSVHQPFFQPMFARLRAAAGHEGLPRALRRFLASPAVAERSDDDKTLLLATRVPPRAATQAP